MRGRFYHGNLQPEGRKDLLFCKHHAEKGLGSEYFAGNIIGLSLRAKALFSYNYTVQE